MAVLFFIISAGIGFVLTLLSLVRASKQGNLSPLRYSLILAAGLGLTTLVSFLAPFFAPNVGVRLEIPTIVFGIALSIFIFVSTYGVVWIWSKIKAKRN